jgi:hypothetical protein
VITPATFVLMIIVGASPAQQRGEFGSYHDCYEAAQREVASLGPTCAGIACRNRETASRNDPGVSVELKRAGAKPGPFLRRCRYAAT